MIAKTNMDTTNVDVTKKELKYNSTLQDTIFSKTYEKTEADFKLYEFIKEIEGNKENHVRDKIDGKWQEQITSIIEDPAQQIKSKEGVHEDLLVLKRNALRSLVPAIREHLSLDKGQLLAIEELNLDDVTGKIDRLIDQQFLMYANKRPLVEVLKAPLKKREKYVRMLFEAFNIKKKIDTPYIDARKPITKKVHLEHLDGDHQTIIANLMILLLLEDEMKNKKVAKIPDPDDIEDETK